MEWIIKLNRSKHLDCIVPTPLSDFSSSLEVVWMTSESYSMCFLLLISPSFLLSIRDNLLYFVLFHVSSRLAFVWNPSEACQVDSVLQMGWIRKVGHQRSLHWSSPSTFGSKKVYDQEKRSPIFNPYTNLETGWNYDKLDL